MNILLVLSHELHCEPRKASDASYRHDFQLELEQREMDILKKLSNVFYHTLIVYRKQLANGRNVDNLKIAHSS